MTQGENIPQRFDRAKEFPNLKENIFLDHAGNTLYSQRQISSFAELLSTNLFTNPHSRHAKSQNTAESIAKIREMILAFFNTNSSEYSVIFTSGATAGMKLLAETFDFGSSGIFGHLREVHTSVLGMREIAKLQNAQIICCQESDLQNNQNFSKIISETSQNLFENSQKLFAISGQCNFSGKKYDLSVIDDLQQCNWKVMLDASSLAATSKLDLSLFKPDFVVLSFYKLFGFPTGIGALLVRKSAEKHLRKIYFGGGTVEIAVGEEQFHVFRSDFVQRFEDGTIAFLDILALKFGFEALNELGGGMEEISERTFFLAKFLFSHLSELRHFNGNPVAVLYNEGDFKEAVRQGPIVAFNLLRSDGSFVGFFSVEKIMESFGIQIRTGCFCNTGACQKYLGLTTEDLKLNFQAGHVCGDSVDLISGKPTGAIRVSFGYMSTHSDAETFLSVIRDVFVEKIPQTSTQVENSDRFVSEMYLYPVKSCRGMRVTEWPIGSDGFRFDRRFFIVNSKGTTMTLKHNAKLNNIHCHVHLPSHPQLTVSLPGGTDLPLPQLTLSVDGQADFQIGLSEPCACGYLKSILQMSQLELEEPDQSGGIIQSRVCGEKVNAFDCGDAAESWLSSFLGDDVYKLLKYKARPESASNAHSAANSAPFLLICTASVRFVLSAIPRDSFRITVEEMIHRMRPNLVIETSAPFEEDSWTKIIIGDIPFEVIEKCSRCQMISVHPRDGTRTVEPLRSIARLRGEKMHFGILIRPLDAQLSDSREMTLKEGDVIRIVKSSQS